MEELIDKLNQRLSIIVPGLYPTWKRNQREVIERINASEKKFIVLRAPTGFGKSAVSVGNIIAQDGRGIILTQTKQLGDQYQKDFLEIGLKTVKGRNNFQCTLMPEKQADEAPCCAGMKCQYKSLGGCPYFDQKRDAAESQLASMNLAYFLYEANYSGSFSDIDILFIDEAHKLEDNLKQFIEVRISRRRFQDEGLSLPLDISFESIKIWQQDAYNKLKPEYEDVLDDLEYNYTNEFLIARGMILQSMLHTLEKLQMVNESWVIEQDVNAVILKPVWIGNYTHQFVFRHASKIVLMSGTLPHSVLEDLGVTDYDYIKISSTFAPENRPIFWIPAANLARSADNPNTELRKLLAATEVILEKHQEEKGIIHTANYNITRYLKENSRFSRIMYSHESAKDRQECVDRFTAATKGVLVSPSFTEGLDLPFDLCRFQIVAKIAYPNLGSPQISKRNEVDPRWYSTQTILSLVQAYGRIMRSEDDSGVTYILDSSLPRLIKRWRTIFDEMEWFLEALYFVQNNKPIPYLDIEGSVQEQLL